MDSPYWAIGIYEPSVLGWMVSPYWAVGTYHPTLELYTAVRPGELAPDTMDRT